MTHRETSSGLSTYYEVIGVAEGASYDAIRDAYRTRAGSLHPDRFADAPERQRSEAEAAMAALNAAWTILSDQERRIRYDLQREQLERWENAAHPVDDQGDTVEYQACEECGEVPTAISTVWAVTSYVLVPRVDRQTGTYCYWCGSEIAEEYRHYTMRWGWWGPLPLVATLIVLWLNRRNERLWTELVPPPRGLDLLALPGSPHAEYAAREQAREEAHVGSVQDPGEKRSTKVRVRVRR